VDASAPSVSAQTSALLAVLALGARELDAGAWRDAEDVLNELDAAEE